MFAEEILTRCSYLNSNPGQPSYITNQALRRLRYLHTSIATRNRRPYCIKDANRDVTEHILPHVCPKMQTFSVSFGPMDSSTSPINRGWCVSTPRGSRETSLSSLRESRHSAPRRRTLEERMLGYQTGLSGISATGIFNDNNGDTRNNYGNKECMVIPQAFTTRKSILTRKVAQRPCKWMVNMDAPRQELHLVRDRKDDRKTTEKRNMLPSIVLPHSEHVQAIVRQTLDVKHVHLKTPPPSPSIRHINIHLPAS